GQRPRYLAALQKLEAQMAQCKRQSEREQERQSACKSAAAAAQGRLEELLKRLGQQAVTGQRPDQQLQKTSAELQKVKEQTTAIRQLQQRASTGLAAAREASELSQEALREAGTRIQSAQERWLDVCGQEQLPPQAEIRTMILNETERQADKAAVEGYVRQVQTVSGQLDRLQKELDGKSLPPIEELQRQQAALIAQKEEADKKVGMMQEQARRLDEASQELARLEKKLRQLDEQYTGVSRLAGLLRGKNAYNTPIHQFVLGMMLDDIVATANEYLNRLSRGQYSLVRMDARGGRGYRGLELYVMDAHRGGMRTVRTLSGGELFLASLSLAFGLSDVVQGYAGGVRLDSIFIDEGFGTLDEETLDAAMMALSQIQSGGRMVGIISHVQELRERIGARIEIVPDPSGGSRAVVKD
ncbi:MAG: hypothetical protein HFE85_03935, partial [Clostridiales bacterium]|nr:hypothetical protein [Clostridiales bacterium]